MASRLFPSSSYLGCRCRTPSPRSRLFSFVVAAAPHPPLSRLFSFLAAVSGTPARSLGTARRGTGLASGRGFRRHQAVDLSRRLHFVSSKLVGFRRTKRRHGARRWSRRAASSSWIGGRVHPGAPPCGAGGGAIEVGDGAPWPGCRVRPPHALPFSLGFFCARFVLDRLVYKGEQAGNYSPVAKLRNAQTQTKSSKPAPRQYLHLHLRPLTHLLCG